MKRVPIDDRKEDFIDTMRNSQVVIVVGETGSGKTTRLPIFLLEAGFAAEGGMIGVTEPRKIAAVATAEFVSHQIGDRRVGDRVGYKVRFDQEVSSSTEIKFMTEGILLRELQLDPDFRRYSVIMVDEAHERGKNCDFLLGLLKDLLKRRSDLKLVVASATIDSENFSRYFGGAPVINVSGRMFPVEVIWNDHEVSEEKMVEAMVEKIALVHEHEASGDILAFMTGEGDIRQVITGLEKLGLSDVEFLPIYGALPFEEQQRIFESHTGKRKVVVATNIAETSLTIDGVYYIVDSGLVKQTNFHPESGIESLDVVPHSQAGCKQREGRAGRTEDGVCYRLYTEKNFQARLQYTKPEILRSNLASVVLTMEEIGISDVTGFDFIDRPDAAAFHESYETLIALGAIRRGEKGLTDMGREMASLPMEPRMSRMILEARKHGCIMEVVMIATLFTSKNLFYRPPKEKWEEQAKADAAHRELKKSGSDAITLLDVWAGYVKSGYSRTWCRENYLNSRALEEAEKIRDQIFDILDSRKIELSQGATDEVISKVVAIGLAYNLFEYCDYHSYGAVQRKLEGVYVHPGSAMFPQQGRFFVTSEVRMTSKSYATSCVPVKPEWLPEIVPALAKPDLPILQSVSLIDGKAMVQHAIAYKGMRVETKVVEVDFTEAERIQQEAIAAAEKKGLVKLKFRREATDYGWGRPGLGDWFANHLGRVVKVLFGSSMIEEGEVYYCELSDSSFDSRRKYAKPIFRVFDFQTATITTPHPAPYPKAVGVESVSKEVARQAFDEALGQLRNGWQERPLPSRSSR